MQGKMSGPEEFDIYVHSPLIEQNADGPYTTYGVFLTTNSPNFEKKKSHTRRRYCDFVAVRNLMCKKYPRVRFPTFPPKERPSQVFSDKTIAERMEGLQQFLNEALQYHEIVQDVLFQKFLQSSVSLVDLIKEYVVDDALYQWFIHTPPGAHHPFTPDLTEDNEIDEVAHPRRDPQTSASSDPQTSASQKN